MQADATHEEHARHCHQSPSTNDSDPLGPPTRQEANAITPAGIRQIMSTKAGRWEGFEEGHKHRRVSEVRRGCVVGCLSAGQQGWPRTDVIPRMVSDILHPRASTIFRTQRRSAPSPHHSLPRGMPRPGLVCVSVHSLSMGVSHATRSQLLE